MSSENGIFLYKSDQGDDAVKGRFMDYFIIACGAGWITGVSQFLFLPFVAMSLALPRKLAVVSYFTFHAELHPHTEQVVFHKAGFFGKVIRYNVDIKNLEKIDSAIIPANQLWDNFWFDEEFVWRDMQSKEVFVFDKNGMWNKDALEHPLLY